MKRVRISELKARLSHYLAGVRRGESLVVTDRRTPIAVLSAYETDANALVIDEPSASLDGLLSIGGVQARKALDSTALLRDDRDAR